MSFCLKISFKQEKMECFTLINRNIGLLRKMKKLRRGKKLMIGEL